MTDEREPLPDELRGWFALEPEAPGPSEADREGIHARVAATLGIAAGAATTGAIGGTAKAAGTGAKILLIGGKLVVLGLVITSIAVVVVATRSDDPAPRPSASLARVPSRSPASAATIAVEEPVPQASASVAAPDPVAPTDHAQRPRAPRVAPAAAIPPQQELLARAWTALSGARAADALDLVERDLRAHPSGAMAEEREALRIRALVALGRVDEARNLVVAFEQSYPDSIHRSLLERVTKPERAEQ